MHPGPRVRTTNHHLPSPTDCLLPMRRVILDGLVKRYAGVAAVDGASFDLRPGEMTYVLGPSGAGKTTLARLVAGLERPDGGEIFFDDRMVQALPAHER